MERPHAAVTARVWPVARSISMRVSWSASKPGRFMASQDSVLPSGDTRGWVSVASLASVRLRGAAEPSAGAAKMSRLVDSGSMRPASRRAK